MVLEELLQELSVHQLDVGLALEHVRGGEPGEEFLRVEEIAVVEDGVLLAEVDEGGRVVDAERLGALGRVDPDDVEAVAVGALVDPLQRIQDDLAVDAAVVIYGRNRVSVLVCPWRSPS